MTDRAAERDAADAADVAATASFEDFLEMAEPRLRRALVARLGRERGREATAEALAWAYEHWERVRAMENPVGYVYRVGVSRTRPPRLAVGIGRARWSDQPEAEPGLVAALGRLSARQRQAVVLVCAYDWTLVEVATVTGRTVSTVNTHLRRGLKRLRADLGSVDP
jgi:DNA-directed RNA polymerase specialized sigma24 family protein